MAKALQEGLEADDYSVQVAHTGEEGFYLIQAQPFDLVILDVMLPGHDGFEILATLRRRGVRTPVLLLTSRDAVEQRGYSSATTEFRGDIRSQLKPVLALVRTSDLAGRIDDSHDAGVAAVRPSPDG